MELPHRPTPYIKQELGARPVDRAKQKAWDRGVEAIETYRQRYGVKDPTERLGASGSNRDSGRLCG